MFVLPSLDVQYRLPLLSLLFALQHLPSLPLIHPLAAQHPWLLMHVLPSLAANHDLRWVLLLPF
jgi:hypothetical protein